MRDIKVWLCCFSVLFSGPVLDADNSASKIAKNSQEHKWKYGITPTGEPAVSFLLMEFKEPEFCRYITVKHWLYFNGLCYASRCDIPQIQSYLVTTSDDRHLEWRDFNGDIHFLVLGENADGWTAKRLPSRGYLVASKAQDIEIVYSHCQPVSLRRGLKAYEFNYTDNRLTGIVRSAPEPVRIVQLDYDEGGTMKLLRSAGKTFDLRYNSNCQLNQCIEVGREQPLLVCDYDRQGLLSLWAARDAEPREFQWCGVRSTVWYRRTSPLPPFVMQDSLFNYDPMITRSHLIVRAHDRARQSTEGWQLELSTGAIIEFSDATNDIASPSR